MSVRSVLHGPVARAGLLCLVVLAGTGCSRWRFAAHPSPAVIAAERPEVVRITKGDGTRLEVRGPTVGRDTIYGTTSVPTCTTRQAFLAEREADCPVQEVTVRLHHSEMVELELRERSVARTAVLAAGLAAGGWQAVRLAARAFGG